jgi:hypothetical protein
LRRGAGVLRHPQRQASTVRRLADGEVPHRRTGRAPPILRPRSPCATSARLKPGRVHYTAWCDDARQGARRRHAVPLRPRSDSASAARSAICRGCSIPRHRLRRLEVAEETEDIAGAGAAGADPPIALLREAGFAGVETAEALRHPLIFQTMKPARPRSRAPASPATSATSSSSRRTRRSALWDLPAGTAGQTPPHHAPSAIAALELRPASRPGCIVAEARTSSTGRARASAPAAGARQPDEIGLGWHRRPRHASATSTARGRSPPRRRAGTERLPPLSSSPSTSTATSPPSTPSSITGANERSATLPRRGVVADCEAEHSARLDDAALWRHGRERPLGGNLRAARARLLEEPCQGAYRRAAVLQPEAAQSATPPGVF